MSNPDPSPDRAADRAANGSRQLSSLQIVFASILAIGLLLAINFSNRIAAGQVAQARLTSLRAEIATLEAQLADLRVELDYVRGDEYVESWARSDGKMVRPGEVLVVPVPAGVPIATPQPTPATPASALLAEQEPIMENWRLWWALFIDDPPPF